MASKIPYYRPPGSAQAREASRRVYESQAERKADQAFYNSKRWRRLRDLVRAEQPLCADCQAQGRVSPTEHVHHIEARKLRPDLAFERSNVVGLCEACHTRRERRGI